MGWDPLHRIEFALLAVFVGFAILVLADWFLASICRMVRVYLSQKQRRDRRRARRQGR